MGTGTRNAGRLGSKGCRPCAPVIVQTLPTSPSGVQLPPGTEGALPLSLVKPFCQLSLLPGTMSNPNHPLPPRRPLTQLSLPISPIAKPASPCVGLPHPT